MATALLKDKTPNRVPIFISAQELARMMRGTEASARTGDLFHMYIDSLHDSRKDVKEMLLDAYTKRTAVLILDGLVSCSRFDPHSCYLWKRAKYNSIRATLDAPHIHVTGRSPRPPAGAAGPGHQDLGRGRPGRGGDVAAERYRGREQIR